MSIVGFKEFIDEASMVKDPYIVIINAGRGRQALWPSSDKPKAYSKAQAEKIVKKQQDIQSKSLTQPYAYHTKPLNKATEYVQSGQAAWKGLERLLDQYGIYPT